MGTLRVNLTDGTSTFISFQNVASVNAISPDDQIAVIQCTEVGGGNVDYAIERYKAADANILWPLMQEVAYIAISINPIEYGYPQLGSNAEAYREWDQAKFATSAVQQALSGQESDEIPYSERTAIAINVIDENTANELKSELESIKSAAEQQRDNTIQDCQDETGAGQTYNGPGGPCPPLNGGQNDPCCALAGEEIYNEIIAKATDLVEIEWKHQYLFEQVQAGGPN